MNPSIPDEEPCRSRAIPVVISAVLYLNPWGRWSFVITHAAYRNGYIRRTYGSRDTRDEAVTTIAGETDYPFAQVLARSMAETKLTLADRMGYWPAPQRTPSDVVNDEDEDDRPY